MRLRCKRRIFAETVSTSACLDTNADLAVRVRVLSFLFCGFSARLKSCPFAYSCRFEFRQKQRQKCVGPRAPGGSMVGGRRAPLRAAWIVFLLFGRFPRIPSSSGEAGLGLHPGLFSCCPSGALCRFAVSGRRCSCGIRVPSPVAMCGGSFDYAQDGHPVDVT